MTKRIFRSICAVALAVFLAALALIMGVLYSYFSQVQHDQLRTETTLAARAVSSQGMDYLTGLDKTECRITWIAADGTVLFDNRNDSSSMENHLEREEVQQALAYGYGESARYSVTLMEQTLYAAQKLDDGSVIRLSVSQSTVLTLILGISQPICVVIAVAIVLSLVLASRLSKKIVEPLNELNLDDPLSNADYDELAPLLRRIDAQQKQLRYQAKELSRKKTEFNTVTRNMSEGLLLLSGEGRILSMNPAAGRLLGVGHSCAGQDFLTVNRTPEVQGLVRQALGGTRSEKTVALLGSIYQVDASPVCTEDGVSGVVLLLIDVTEKERAQQLRREFTSNVSHELKTPLHAISGYAELMKGGIVKAEDIPQFSEKIYAEAQRLIGLVEDILRLSRLDDGGDEMTWEQVDLMAVTKETVSDLASSAALAEVRVEVVGGPTVVRGIRQLLGGIVSNLVGNAIKYNRPGGSVTVTLGGSETDVTLTVADTGIGIPAEHQSRVFERFYRVDKSHSKEVGGTGLGLSIVKHAVMIHKGTVDLRSTPGIGTTVTVTLPRT